MAKQTVGKLNVMLSAKTGAFNKGMSRAGKRVTGFSRTIRAGAMKVGAFGAAIAGVGAGAGLAMMLRNTLSTMDATTKLGVAIGIATDKLVAYQFGAKIAGSSQESLNKGLKFLQKTIGETTTGISTEGVKAFELLGLSAEKLSAQPISETFKDISQSISEVENVSERAAIAQRLFGRAGKELMNLLLEGRAGLEGYEEEARALGITFGELGGEKVEMANDAMTRLQAVFQGVAQTLTIKLTPFITAFANKMTDAGKSGGGMADKVGKGFETVMTFAAKASDFLKMFEAAWATLKAGALHAISLILKGLRLFMKDLIWVANSGAFKSMFGGGAAESMIAADEALGKGADELTKAGRKAWNLSIDLMMEANSGATQAAVKKWYEGLKKTMDTEAAKIAKKSGEMRALGLGKAPAAPAGTRPQSFSQIVRSRVAGGMKRATQKVTDPELLQAVQNVDRTLMLAFGGGARVA